MLREAKAQAKAVALKKAAREALRQGFAVIIQWKGRQTVKRRNETEQKIEDVLVGIWVHFMIFHFRRWCCEARPF